MQDSKSDPFVEVGGQPTRESLTVIMAQGGTKSIDIPEDGIALEKLELYNDSFSYVVKGQAISPSTLLHPGDVVHVAKHHSNGQ